MLSAAKMALLQSFLGSLPKDVASRLAFAVELDRLADGKQLPHETILEGLRPVLRVGTEQQRVPTPLRLFCRPFEDLLVNVVSREKQRGRVARAHVVSIWHWVSQILIAPQAQVFAADIRALALRDKHEDALQRAGEFWPLAGAAMRDALEKNHKAAVTALNGEPVAADAEDVAQLLEVGNSMVAIQEMLPKPTPVLTDELLWGLRRIFDEVYEHHNAAAPLVSVVAMRRLVKPWEALKLPLSVARQTHDTLISSTDMGLAGDVLFADMDDYRDAITNIRQPQFDEGVLIANLAAFTAISTAIVKEVEILRQGRWGQRLLKDRADVGGMMDAMMERAPKEIAGAMPTHKAGYSGGPRVPDFGRPVDADRVTRALRYAKVLRGTRLLAVPGSFGAKHQDAIDEACLSLRSYSEDVLKELRSAEGARREIVEKQFQLTMDLTAILFDDDEVEFLRRRGKAAGAQILAA